MNAMRTEFKKGMLYCGIGFLLLFLSRLTYLSLAPPAPAPPNIQLDGYSRKWETNIQNYASTRMVYKELQTNTTYSVDQKYQKVADISAATGRFSQDEQKARQLIKDHQALIQFEQNSGLPGGRFLNLSIGVPPAKFDALVGALKKVGVLQGFEVNKIDKTNDFKELQGKRRSLEQTRGSLLALKQRGGNIAEFIQLENKLAELESELQKLGVQLGEFDVTNEFCTVKLALQERDNLVRNSLFDHAFTAFTWTIGYYLGLMIILLLGGLTGLVAVQIWASFKTTKAKA
jgi:hypothetical protein